MSLKKKQLGNNGRILFFMIDKLLGELYWDELSSKIQSFMKEEGFSTFSVMFTTTHTDHCFLASCELLSSYINFTLHGPTDLWSKTEREWTSGDIEKTYPASELIKELEKNLIWVRNYLIERIIGSGCQRNIEGTRIFLLPGVPEEKKRLFHELSSELNLEKTWEMFLKFSK